MVTIEQKPIKLETSIEISVYITTYLFDYLGYRKEQEVDSIFYPLCREIPFRNIYK